MADHEIWHINEEDLAVRAVGDGPLERVSCGKSDVWDIM